MVNFWWFFVCSINIVLSCRYYYILSEISITRLNSESPLEFVSLTLVILCGMYFSNNSSLWLLMFNKLSMKHETSRYYFSIARFKLRNLRPCFVFGLAYLNVITYF